MRNQALTVALSVVAGLFGGPVQAIDSARETFAEWQRALAKGDLAQAETAFRRVLAIHQNDAGAHADLGVIAIRRKQWKTALDELQIAERLAPNIVGIRVNIGLVYFRQSDFHYAVGPFQSVIRDDPRKVKFSEAVENAGYYACSI